MRSILVMMGIGLVTLGFTASRASAALDLSAAGHINIGLLGFNGVGGAAFDDSTGNLWISDSGPATNNVIELNPLGPGLDIGAFFDASVVPGLGQGPDAMALHPVTGNLFLFSAFQETDQSGEVTQAGVYVPGFDGPSNVGGASFNSAGELFAFDQGTGTIGKLDPVTGAILQVIPLIGFSDRIGAADFDPVTGNLIAYSTNTKELLEIVPTTGEILSFTDVSSFLVLPSFPTGMAFNGSGDVLYIASGQNAGGDRIEILNRVIPEPSTLLLTAVSSMLIVRQRRRQG